MRDETIDSSEGGKKRKQAHRLVINQLLFVLGFSVVQYSGLWPPAADPDAEP